VPQQLALLSARYNIEVSTATTTTNSVADERKPRFTRRERMLLWLITWLGYISIRLIGRTLRYSVYIEEGGPPALHSHPLILCFWHEGIFISTYVFRDQKIGVISSHSFDGEYTGRIISKFNYVPIKGSSSKGAIRAFLRSRRHLEQGNTVAFTSDGPRGPAHVAKPGPVLLAGRSGLPMVAFHIAAEKAWRLHSWDRAMIPKPFSRAFICVGKKIVVPRDATETQMEACQSELQLAQERVRDFAELNVVRVGGPEFPVHKI
jgi:lysophospholipid acyltransferase (LPLAT)-like uncharacterized protein